MVFNTEYDNLYWMEYSHIDSVFFRLKIFIITRNITFIKKALKSIENNSYFSEVSLVYSNITGGFGFFGGYTAQEYSMKVNKDMVEYK